MEQAIAGLILAGGQGRRMGGVDKAMLPLGGRPLIAHTLARFAPQVGALAISANGDPARFAGFGLPVLRDTLADQGPLSGVIEGLGWAARSGARALVTLAVDTPLAPADLVARLAEGGLERAAVAVAGDRIHATAALWPVALYPHLVSLFSEGERRLRVALESARAVGFPAPEAFHNINTPEDLARADALLVGRA